MFLKPFFCFFVFFALASVGIVLAQDVPVEGLPFVIENVTLPADTLAVDSTALKPVKEPPFKSRIKYKATDSVKFIIPANRAYMYRGTQVNYEDIELKSFKTEFDMASKIVYAKGGRDSLNHYMEAPAFKQGNDEYEADSMSYNFDTKKGVIHRIKFHQGEGHLQAVKAKHYEDGHIDMAGGIYTTCDADHPHFGLRLTRGKVIPGDQVVFGPAYIEILDIPLYFLALPFGFFPQTNKKAVSGIIPPSIGMEISRGLSLTDGGYYFAFNDHFDARLMGDIYSSGTWRAALSTRYMTRYKFTGDLNMSYGVTVSGEKGLDQVKQKQYSVTWAHRQDAKANPSQSFQANVNYSSSSYDREFNYTNENAFYNNTKNSSINYSKRWPNTPFSFSTNMRVNQSSQTQRVSIDFPNFNFRMERIYPFRKKESMGKPKWYEDIALQYDATMQNTLEGKEDDLFNERNLQKMRNGFQHKVPFSVNFKALKFINITPSLNYTGVFYTRQIKRRFEITEIDTTNNVRGVLVTDTIRGLSYAHILAPSLSVSLNPKFYLTNVYKSTSKVEAIRTVISPTVGMSYTPNMRDVFNNYDSYIDREGKTKEYSIYEQMGAYSVPMAPGQSGSVSMGVNGNVEMKVRSGKDSTAVSRKVKLLNNISANTSYNMFADSMKFNNVSLSANTTVFGLNLALSGSVNPYKLTPAGTRINQYGPQLTSMSFNTGLSLPLKKDKKEEKKDENKDDYAYFDMPWNVSLNYGLNYSKQQFDSKVTQTLSFSGNVNFTAKWSLNFSSSYDFDAKKIAYTQASIQRDLHCWQMSLSFSPFGVNKFYFFKINVKSGTLQDLKYEKRKTAGDFARQGW